MNKPRNPCYGCQDRAIGCHSKCERYAAFREKLDRYNEETRPIYMDWSNMKKLKKNKKKLKGGNFD